MPFQARIHGVLFNFQVIAALERKIRAKGKRKYAPPAFFARDGSFTQPPSFEMPATIYNEDLNRKISAQNTRHR